MSMLLILSKNQLLELVIPYIIHLFFLLILSALSLTVSWYLLLLGMFCFVLFCSFICLFVRTFRYSVKLLVWYLWNFILKALSEMNYPLNINCILSHKFGLDMSSFFSLFFKYVFIRYFLYLYFKCYPLN